MQKMRFIFIILSTSFLLIWGLPAYAAEPIEFSADAVSIRYDSADGGYYMIISDIGVGEHELWVEWQLNLNNVAWELHDGGTIDSISGSFASNGRYVYDSEKAVLIVDVDESDFAGCGLFPGTHVFFVSTIFPKSASLTDPLEEGVILPISRANGAFGDITGTWTLTEGENIYTLTFASDNTFLMTAAISSCD